MRIARKLTLLCALAIAAMAFTAGSASAAETAIEVETEAGARCNPVCNALAQGESHITRTFDGVEISKCRDTFETEFRHLQDANRLIGHVYSWVRANHEVVGPGCNVEPCEVAAEREWNITNAGETAANTGHFTVRFCLQEGVAGNEGADTHCNLEVTITETTPHRHTLSANGLCGFGLRRVEGSWSQIVDANHPAIEVDHTPGT